jgi:hypothetical protein
VVERDSVELTALAENSRQVGSENSQVNFKRDRRPRSSQAFLGKRAIAGMPSRSSPPKYLWLTTVRLR